MIACLMFLCKILLNMPMQGCEICITQIHGQRRLEMFSELEMLGLTGRPL